KTLVERHLKFHRDDLRTRLLPQLEGRVFHVTTRAAYQGILETGTINLNQDGSLGYTFGQSETSYFRRRGCISVVDLREVKQEELDDGLLKYYFLNPSFAKNKPVFLQLSPSTYATLIPWSRWKDEQAWGEMVVPYIESGYAGSIGIGSVEEVILADIMNPQGQLEKILRQVEKSISKPRK
ncbi:MAG: hypothetical protein QMD32_09320, partial [Smithellaceae bacterium]|nr:hypothetical protein [Smithellaceae bacterium]